MLYSLVSRPRPFFCSMVCVVFSIIHGSGRVVKNGGGLNTYHVNGVWWMRGGGGGGGGGGGKGASS